LPRRRPNGPLGAACWALALAIATAFPNVLRAAVDLPGELTTVAAVRFEGRHRVSAKELRAVLKTRSPSALFWRKRPLLRFDFLRSDTLAIESIYQQHGYLDAKARYELRPARKRGAVVVVFMIQEGMQSRIDRVEFTGVTVVPEETLRRSLFARPRKPFNPYYLVADTTKIAEIYQDRGYFPLVSASHDRHDDLVTVRYTVVEGQLFRFGEVFLSNPEPLTVKERLVRRELIVPEGAVYRVSRVQRSVERLYETGLFNQVQMTPLVDSTRSVVEFDLRLRERKPRWFDAGVGSGTAERLRLTGEWGHRNVLSRGMQGVLSSRLALDGQARFLLSRGEASLVEPWLAGTRTRGQLTGYYENRHDHVLGVLIEQDAKGVSFQVRRQLGRWARLTLAQDNAFVHQQLTFKDPTLSQEERDSLTATVVPRYSTHRIQLGLERDTRDHPIQMSRGSYQVLSGEVAGGPLQGTSSFTKGQFASSWYTPVRRKEWIFATRARAGVIRPFGETLQLTPGLDPDVARVPFEDRFNLGGVNSLRGYDENELPGTGGLLVLQANAELRVPVAGPLGLELYVDAGNVWNRSEDIHRGKFTPAANDVRMGPSDVRFVFGFGPRLQLPFGPLRLDFSWWARPDGNGKRQRGKPQFAIGPAF
jgi:outer membrane protein insertion porin family